MWQQFLAFCSFSWMWRDYIWKRAWHHKSKCCPSSVNFVFFLYFANPLIFSHLYGGKCYYLIKLIYYIIAAYIIDICRLEFTYIYTHIICTYKITGGGDNGGGCLKLKVLLEDWFWAEYNLILVDGWQKTFCAYVTSWQGCGIQYRQQWATLNDVLIW